MKYTIYRVHYNWFYCIQFGEVFGDFTVGKSYQDPVTGEESIVTKIERNLRGNVDQAIISFENGTTRLQENLNAVLYKQDEPEEE